MTKILGISSYYHDSAATLMVDGEIIAAAQEERFTRVKQDNSFPRNAIKYVLSEAKIDINEIDYFAYYEDSELKFQRVLQTAIVAGFESIKTYSQIIKSWVFRKRKITKELAKELSEIGVIAPKIKVFKHHESHAASAFFPSPFESAAVLCIDGVGEWQSTTIWKASTQGLKLVCDLNFPNSLGLLYSAFTHFCGFKVDSGEYKLMGLAPYGQPKYVDTILSELIDIKPDGSFRLNWKKFSYIHGRVMTGRHFEKLFGGEARKPESVLTQRELDLASSIQHVTEIIVTRLAHTARTMTGELNLCIAGGVGLNCVANGKISQNRTFENIWIQPASGDAGCSLGAAILAGRASGIDSKRSNQGHQYDAMKGSLLGPSFSDREILSVLNSVGASFEQLSEEELNRKTVNEIKSGGIVGWFQGRMEFGPRALGSRSILGDPRDGNSQVTMNMRIKFRESFRPFAPAVLLEDANEYFNINSESPYMLLVSEVAEQIRKNDRVESDQFQGLDKLKVIRSEIPAVTHVDYTARVQTVDKVRNPRFRSLLEDFKSSTGCPVLINTSFNVRGEPIVNSPLEAYVCFMRTNMDALAIGPFYLKKSRQPSFEEDFDWRKSIKLD